jgi:hypothetical protein
MVGSSLATIIYNDDALEDFLYSADVYRYERFDGERWVAYKYRVHYYDGSFAINIECDGESGAYEVVYRGGGRSVGVLGREEAGALFRSIDSFIKGGKLGIMWDVAGVPDFLNAALREVAEMVRADPKRLISSARDIYTITVFNRVTGEWEFDELVVELRFGLANVDVRIDRGMTAVITAWIPRGRREASQVSCSTSEGVERIFELLGLEKPRPLDDA